MAKSINEQALQNINEIIAGRQGVYKIQVGDKQIQYSSFDQLMKWKNYFQKQIRKQQGKPAQVRAEKIYYKGI